MKRSDFRAGLASPPSITTFCLFVLISDPDVAEARQLSRRIPNSAPFPCIPPRRAVLANACFPRSPPFLRSGPPCDKLPDCGVAFVVGGHGKMSRDPGTFLLLRPW